MTADLCSSMLAITGVSIYDPLISCSGVMFPMEVAHEYRDGRKDQALDGA
jgi:hypothetical protein